MNYMKPEISSEPALGEIQATTKGISFIEVFLQTRRDTPAAYEADE